MCVHVEPNGATCAANHWPERGQARWHGLPSRVGRQGAGGNRKNAARRWGGAVLAGAFSGRVALTSHQTNPYFVWLMRAAPCNIYIHVMSNVYMGGNEVIQQLTLVSVTRFLEGLPLPVTKPSQVLLCLLVIP